MIQSIPSRSKHISLPLPPEEARQAELASRQLANQLLRDGDLAFRAGDNEYVTVPKTAIGMLVDILEQMAKGNTMTLVPLHAELTTQQAAEFLGVSRPYLIRLLEGGKIPFHKTGTHRRIRFEDLAKFKDEKIKQRRKSLDELAALSQEMDLE